MLATTTHHDGGASCEDRRTFDTSELMPQLSKTSDHGVVLHALASLAAQSPTIGEAIMGGIVAEPRRGALTPPARRRARRPKMNGIGASSKNGGNGRVRRARMLLDGGSYRDAF